MKTYMLQFQLLYIFTFTEMIYNSYKERKWLKQDHFMLRCVVIFPWVQMQSQVWILMSFLLGALPPTAVPLFVQLNSCGCHLGWAQSSGLDRWCYHYILTKLFISFSWATLKRWLTLDNHIKSRARQAQLVSSGLTMSTRKLISACFY